MLSIKPLQSAKSACDYYMQALEYYQGDATAMQWLGRGAQYLKLDDNIDSKALLNLLQGLLPNGQKLQNPRGEHRPGFDMTFSAPKSVSILAGLGVAPELIDFHDEAVKYAISHIESEFAEARVRRDGEMTYVKTDNLLVASFRQPSSRANDPALHTHCVTLNMTFLNGKARSLASDKSRTHGVVEQIQNNAHYCGLLYRQHLANRLKEAGFRLRLTGDGLFEIEGVPDIVLSEFSRRREDIERLMNERGWSGAKSASAATLITRTGKEEHDLSTLQADWQERSQALDFDAKLFMQNRTLEKISNNWFSLVKEKLHAIIIQRGKNSLSSENNAALACVQVAIETLSQRTSVFTERALFAEGLKHSLIYDKAIPAQLITDAIQHEKATQSLYAASCPETQQTLLTTPWLLTLETETIARIENNREAVAAIASRDEIKAFQKKRATTLVYPMTASQKEAMTVLLTTKGRYLAIQGYAGVAKTSMLAEARLLIEEKGYQLRGLTVASSAAHELQTKAGIRSDVFPIVHQELKKAPTGSLSKTIYIVDEASMLSSPQGHELLKQVERTQARLVLVGDRAQLPSIQNGRIFGLIQDYGVEMAQMNDIVRQQNPVLKEAVIHAIQGNVQGALQKLDAQELPTHEERVRWIASHWLSLTKEQRDATLLFAPTHADRSAITQLIRDGLKTEGALKGASIMHPVLKSKNLEPIQQRFIAYYQTGDVVRFNQPFHKNRIKSGDYYTVASITSKHRRDNVLPLTNEQGKITLFPLKSLPDYKTHTSSFERVLELYRVNALELRAGDKVMWTRNLKSEDISNGDILTLQAIQDNHLIFTTKDNQSRLFEKNHPALKHLDYSYVLTNYKVQGKDATYGIGLMESYHHFGATMKNFYVQISRAIHGMTLVTDNKEQLTQAILRNHDEKQASLDMVSRTQLKMHDNRFKVQTNVSIQPVIDRKRDFEKQTQELRFEKHSYHKMPVLIKELER